MHRGSFKIGLSDHISSQTVSELTGISIPRILDKFAELKGSFLKSSRIEGEEVWSFAHPTIADALTEILRQKPHMMAALIRGAPIDTVLSSFACEGAPIIRDALTISSTLNETLVARLLQTPDETETNRSLFWFLAKQSNDDVFQSLVHADPNILNRKSWNTYKIANSSQFLVYGRAHRLGLLGPDLRENAASRLENAVENNFDLSFFENEDILALIPSKRLVSLGIKLRTQILPNASEHIGELASNADLDDDPESHFELVSEALRILESTTDLDDEAEQRVDEARDKIRDEVSSLTRRIEERDSERNDETDWSQISAVSSKQEHDIPTFKEASTRSVFDDIDQ